MSRYRRTRTRLAICCAALSLAGCQTLYSDVGECPRWSDPAIEEFVELNRQRGESPLVQQVKRLAQFCGALRAD